MHHVWCSSVGVHLDRTFSRSTATHVTLDCQVANMSLVRQVTGTCSLVCWFAANAEVGAKSPSTSTCKCFAGKLTPMQACLQELACMLRHMSCNCLSRFKCLLLSKHQSRCKAKWWSLQILQHPMYHKMTAAGPNKVSCKTYKAHM